MFYWFRENSDSSLIQRIITDIMESKVCRLGVAHLIQRPQKKLKKLSELQRKSTLMYISGEKCWVQLWYSFRNCKKRDTENGCEKFWENGKRLKTFRFRASKVGAVTRIRTGDLILTNSFITIARCCYLPQLEAVNPLHHKGLRLFFTVFWCVLL